MLEIAERYARVRVHRPFVGDPEGTSTGSEARATPLGGWRAGGGALPWGPRAAPCTGGYFLANRIATCDAINPAPPVMRTFFASYGSLACWVSAVIFRAVSPSPFAFPGVGGAQSIYIFSAIVAKASRNGWTGSFLSFTLDSTK